MTTQRLLALIYSSIESGDLFIKHRSGEFYSNSSWVYYPMSYSSSEHIVLDIVEEVSYKLTPLDASHLELILAAQYDIYKQ